MNTGLLLASCWQDVGPVCPHHLLLSFAACFLVFEVPHLLQYKVCFNIVSFEVGLPLLMFKPDCSSMKASGKQHIFSFCYVFQARRRTGTPRENIKKLWLQL